MDTTRNNILLIGSNVTIRNIPLQEVSLLHEGQLPAYGYNPGDFIELLAGEITVEEGRLEQCLTWLDGFLNGSSLSAAIKRITYGQPKEVVQLFRKWEHSPDPDHGWFMAHQLLPAAGRRLEGENENGFDFTQAKGVDGIILIDDSGRPPGIAEELHRQSPDAWVVAMGISVSHWRQWALSFGDRFTLLGRLSDLETTRMEMDASTIWESIVAMSLRALFSSEVGLWDETRQQFRCHAVIEMFPHGILYVGPKSIFFRHGKGALPEKSSPRNKGSVPVYDTMVAAMLALECLRFRGLPDCRSYWFDFSQRILRHWEKLYNHGYFFDNGLEFPLLDFTDTFPDGMPCSLMETGADPCFLAIDPKALALEKTLDMVAGQEWNNRKKGALRSFFSQECATCSTTSPDHIAIILQVLHLLKEEVIGGRGFADNLRLFHIGNLRSTDPAEIDPIITLQGVMASYVSKESVQRPLCIGVFGPPGSGKSFSVKEVARAISQGGNDAPFTFFEFNLTQFSNPDQINGAIDQVRAAVAAGSIPVVFWDEFDCRYNGHEFGYLRYFLPAMQDGVTYANGIPYHIGRSIFVFAGGVKASWADMEAILTQGTTEELALKKALKIPDFMSRLRVVLDIDGIGMDDGLLTPDLSPEKREELRLVLLKRAFIIAHQMSTHWKKAARKTSGLLLRLLLARYKFGARSIEAVIEASRAADRLVYGLPELLAPSSARIHAVWRVELEREVDAVRKKTGQRAVW